MVALVVFSAYLLLNSRGEGSWSLWPDKRGLGVVKVNGPIIESTEILHAISILNRDPQVKAIVVRIDSPGGAVGASQEIYKALRDTAKPTIASLGNVAASGGYYIASACDEIISNPGTITGSIGVITTIPNLEELFSKLGIKIQVLTSGPLKGVGQSSRPLNPEEEALLQGIIQDLHSQFVMDVASGRALEENEVLPLADGRVFTGRQALENGLVDSLGNYQDAIESAIKLGNLSYDPNIICPQEDNIGFWQSMGAQSAQAFHQQLMALLVGSSLPGFMMPAPGSGE